MTDFKAWLLKYASVVASFLTSATLYVASITSYAETPTGSVQEVVALGLLINGIVGLIAKIFSKKA